MIKTLVITLLWAGMSSLFGWITAVMCDLSATPFNMTIVGVVVGGMFAIIFLAAIPTNEIER